MEEFKILATVMVAWIAGGVVVLVLASIGDIRRIEIGGFFRPYHGLWDLLDLVFGRTAIVVAAGPSLLLNPEFRVASGLALKKLGQKLVRLAKRIGEYMNEG